MTKEEAIEVYKELINPRIKEAFETFAPELVENEDERIRKEIISMSETLGRKNWIAWLEKKCEPVDINPSEFDLCLNKLLKQFETLPKEELASSLSFYLNVVQNNGTYKEEKQGEQETLCDKCRKAQPSHSCQDITALGRCALEKQGEQKPTDKIESKFKEGYWIIGDKDNTVHQVKAAIENVSNGKYAYDLIDGGYISTSHESDYHLWTIQDAKDGDVLSDGTTIFIFKDLLSDGSVMSYCDYDTDSCESDAFCPLSVNLICSKITPAAIEQRDLLFQKMHEAGYEWSDKDRKLIKIVK